jgi:hypothetical protein
MRPLTIRLSCLKLLVAREVGECGHTTQGPDEDVADGVGRLQFARGDGLGEQGLGVMTGAFGLGEGGGEGIGAALVLYALGKLRGQDGTKRAPVVALACRGWELTACPARSAVIGAGTAWRHLQRPC